MHDIHSVCHVKGKKMDNFVAGQETELLLKEQHFLCLYRKNKAVKQDFTPELLRRARNQIFPMINRLKHFRDQQVPQDPLRDASLPEYATNNVISHVWQINKQQSLQYQPYRGLVEKRKSHVKYLLDRNPSMFHTIDVDMEESVSSMLQSVDPKDDIVVDFTEPSPEDLQMVGLSPPVSKKADVALISGSINISKADTGLSSMCVDSEILPA
jgi:hypothetical protein